MMKNYYRLATEVDSTCGRVLDELKKQGVLDNTLVIFTTDNGYYHAEHGLADKWYPHQESIRVPLIIHDPRMPKDKRGTTNDDFTLNVDLAPTILAAASGSFAAPRRACRATTSPPLLSSEERCRRNPSGARSSSTSTRRHPEHQDFIPASEALVRKDWKYFHWPDFGAEQLFDLTTDPSEERDLAAAKEQTSRLAEMRTRFKELKAAAR